MVHVPLVCVLFVHGPLIHGMWSVVLGPESVVLCPWSVVRGLWSVVCGPWSVDHGLWSLFHGPGLRSVVYGPCAINAFCS